MRGKKKSHFIAKVAQHKPVNKKTSKLLMNIKECYVLLNRIPEEYNYSNKLEIQNSGNGLNDIAKSVSNETLENGNTELSSYIDMFLADKEDNKSCIDCLLEDNIKLECSDEENDENSMRLEYHENVPDNSVPPFEHEMFFSPENIKQEPLDFLDSLPEFEIKHRNPSNLVETTLELKTDNLTFLVNSKNTNDFDVNKENAIILSIDNQHINSKMKSHIYNNYNTSFEIFSIKGPELNTGQVINKRKRQLFDSTYDSISCICLKKSKPAKKLDDLFKKNKPKNKVKVKPFQRFNNNTPKKHDEASTSTELPLTRSQKSLDELGSPTANKKYDREVLKPNVNVLQIYSTELAHSSFNHDLSTKEKTLNVQKTSLELGFEDILDYKLINGKPETGVQETSGNKYIYKCSYCPITFTSLSSAKTHKHSVSCYGCKEVFPNKANLRGHIYSVHVFVCEFCRVKFDSKELHDKHICYYKEYKCIFCNKLFKSHTLLKVHMVADCKEASHTK